MVNYMKLIKETIQQHPEINPLVVADVLKRSKDWLKVDAILSMMTTLSVSTNT